MHLKNHDRFAKLSSCIILTQWNCTVDDFGWLAGCVSLHEHLSFVWIISRSQPTFPQHIRSGHFGNMCTAGHWALLAVSFQLSRFLMFIFCQANIERLTSMEKLLCTTCSFDAAQDWVWYGACLTQNFNIAVITDTVDNMSPFTSPSWPCLGEFSCETRTLAQAKMTQWPLPKTSSTDTQNSTKS